MFEPDLNYTFKGKIHHKAKLAMSADEPKFVDNQSQVLSYGEESYYNKNEKCMEEPLNIDETLQRLKEDLAYLK